jgi:SOS-response transcriptional repressor LexA
MDDQNIQEVYDFIRDYITENGVSPSQREIAKNCYLNQATVGKLLAVLEARGLITRLPGCARSISLTTSSE